MPSLPRGGRSRNSGRRSTQTDRGATLPAQADPLTPPAQGSAEERGALHVAEPPVSTSVSSRTDKRSVAKPPVSTSVSSPEGVFLARKVWKSSGTDGFQTCLSTLRALQRLRRQRPRGALRRAAQITKLAKRRARAQGPIRQLGFPARSVQSSSGEHLIAWFKLSIPCSRIRPSRPWLLRSR